MDTNPQHDAEQTLGTHARRAQRAHDQRVTDSAAALRDRAPEQDADDERAADPMEIRLAKLRALRALKDRLADRLRISGSYRRTFNAGIDAAFLAIRRGDLAALDAAGIAHCDCPPGEGNHRLVRVHVS